MSDKVKVLLKASETVVYKQEVEMSLSDYERLKEAWDNADDKEIEWLMDAYIDRMDVYDSYSFELDDFENLDEEEG